MRPIALNVIVAAVLIGVAGPALSHNCDARSAYLRGNFDGECPESIDQPEGMGKAKGADTYEGMFHIGYPEGKGVYTWEKGGKLEGQFKKGKANGPGVYTSPKNVTYEGEFKNGKFVGTIERADCPVTPGPLNC